MTNVTVQEALNSAILDLEHAEKWEGKGQYANSINRCKAAIADIEKCEPVAYMSRSKMTDYAISLLPTRIARETEIAKGWSDWHSVEVEKYKFYLSSVGKSDWLSDYEFIPLYTLPQPREWVGLDEVKIREIGANIYGFCIKSDDVEFAEALIYELKQLNSPDTKG